ncbi:MAG: hypothetical protein WC501_02045 [Candidatus Micrarchaeia archaeon]
MKKDFLDIIQVGIGLVDMREQVLILQERIEETEKNLQLALVQDNNRLTEKKSGENSVKISDIIEGRINIAEEKLKKTKNEEFKKKVERLETLLKMVPPEIFGNHRWIHEEGCVNLTKLIWDLKKEGMKGFEGEIIEIFAAFLENVRRTNGVRELEGLILSILEKMANKEKKLTEVEEGLKEVISKCPFVTEHGLFAIIKNSDTHSKIKIEAFKRIEKIESMEKKVISALNNSTYFFEDIGGKNSMDAQMRFGGDIESVVPDLKKAIELSQQIGLHKILARIMMLHHAESFECEVLALGKIKEIRDNSELELKKIKNILNGKSFDPATAGALREFLNRALTIRKECEVVLKSRLGTNLEEIRGTKNPLAGDGEIVGPTRRFGKPKQKENWQRIKIW